MKKAIHNKRAKMQLTGIVIATCLLLPLFDMLLPDLPSSSMMRESFWAHKIDAKPVYDVIFVGDSRIYRGIDPEVFEKECKTGLKAFNYGFSSAGLDTFLLGRAARLLDASGKKVLVIGVSANAFLPESIRNNHIRSLLEWNQKDVWIKKHLYPYLQCFDPYHPISTLFKMRKGERYDEDYHIKSGFAASNKTPLDSGSALEAYRLKFEQQQYDTIAGENFIRYVEQLRTNGVKVILVRVPCTFAMKQLEDKYTHGQFNVLREKLSLRGFTWIEPAGDYTSYDGSHLDSRSAELLSGELAHKIDICKDR
jgi:hypothetical protein